MSDTDTIHDEHCARCHLIKCPFGNDYGCQVVSCPQCLTKLHNCKIEDHMENICYKSFLPCINVEFGCDGVFRRDKRAAHLATCSASILVCGREWGRRVLSPNSKLELKKYGKEQLLKEEVHIPDGEIDIAATNSDQNLIISSYGYSRAHRNRLRDGLNKAHPVVPLRRVCEQQESAQTRAETSRLDENSSDEEKREKEAKMRKKKAMFANCYMCQIDPASQHLHTLGNDSAKYTLGRPVRKWGASPDLLHDEYQLKVSSMAECIPEFMVKGENIRFIGAGGTLYTRRCLRVVRRMEYGDHHLSQHVNSFDSLSDLIVRCPNWIRGCTFHSYRLKPKHGQIRFSSFLDSFVHCPETDCPDYNGKGFDSLPAWAVLEVVKYLPSSAISNLSTTCRSLRDTLFTYSHRWMTELMWKRTEEGWRGNGTKKSLSVSDCPASAVWMPPPGLSDHLSQCSFFEPVSYDAEKVSVFPENLLEDIESSFCERLPSVRRWWSTFQHGHSDSILFAGNNGILL